MESRLQKSARNAFWSYISMIISIVLSFVSRTIFVYTLGETYLGVSGLFSNVLGVLSFAELGIGSAFGFSLYKPVAEHDLNKIKSYMHYYKWAYRVIAAVVATIGILIMPLLKYVVNDPGDIGNIYIYYLIYLFNTVSSYFVSYKFSLVNAEQKNYIYTNANMLISFSTTIIQCVSLLVFRNFLVYLLVAAVFGLFQKIFVSIYFDKLYPYLKDTQIEKLTKEERDTLISKVKALIVHKIGEISVHQTDNIVVSAFVSTKMVGLLSNYNLITSTISSCISILFNSVTGSLGNLVAVESKEYQYAVFKKYRFVGFWFYGFTAIAMAILSSPFITLWLGERMVVDQLVINLILINYYMIGHRVCLNNIKSAAGMYEQDKYVALIQAIVNLVVSIVMVKIIGLPGVYIGTIVQGLLSTIIKPIVSYKQLFGLSSKLYFIDSIKYAFAVLIAYFICVMCANYLLSEITIVRFAATMGVVAFFPNVLFVVIFGRTEEFKWIYTTLKKIVFGKVVRKI